MSVVTLTYRQLTKEDNFFSVQYQEDDFLQVRGRGFLHTDERVRNSRFFFYKKKKKKNESTTANVSWVPNTEFQKQSAERK